MNKVSPYNRKCFRYGWYQGNSASCKAQDPVSGTSFRLYSVAQTIFRKLRSLGFAHLDSKSERDFLWEGRGAGVEYV